MKAFWEENFTGKEYLFLSVNMNIFGRHNVRKHKEIRGSDKCVTMKKPKEIRGSDKYATLEISSKFDSLDIFRVNRKIGKIRKGVDYLSGFQEQIKVRKNTKRQGMPLELSARRTFLRLLRILRKLRNYIIKQFQSSLVVHFPY